MGDSQKRTGGDKMTSIFRRLLNTEFGEEYYNQFFFSFQRRMVEKRTLEKRVENEDIYRELYRLLKGKERPALKKMEARLSDAMYYTVKIGRTYFWAFLFYLAASLFLIALRLHPYATLPALIGISAGFFWKTYEFVINKYCYIDAYIILLYKAALEKVLQESSSAV